MGLAHAHPIMVKSTFIQLHAIGVLHASLVSSALLPSLTSTRIGGEFDDVIVCSALEGTSKVVHGPTTHSVHKQLPR